MARGGLCGRCGGTRRGPQARAASPVTQCARCSEWVCDKHARWDVAAGQNVCTTCARKLGLTVLTHH